MPPNDAISALADRLRPARRAVVFTGAGISTESGIPDFRSPGGLWKTAVISFGQALPKDAWSRAEDETLAADLYLVLGSSLTVRPAAELPRMAWEAGVPLVIVNRDPTPFDHMASLALREEIGP